MTQKPPNARCDPQVKITRNYFGSHHNHTSSNCCFLLKKKKDYYPLIIWQSKPATSEHKLVWSSAGPKPG